MIDIISKLSNLINRTNGIKGASKADVEQTNQDFWFPGRWIGGVSLVIAPLALFAGVVIRSSISSSPNS